MFRRSHVLLRGGLLLALSAPLSAAAQDPGVPATGEPAGQDPPPEEEEVIRFPPPPMPIAAAPWVEPSAEEWSARVARDARASFTARSSIEAMRELDRPFGAPEGRPDALLALGACGDPASRARLSAWALEGTIDERMAAVLAIGELGAAGSDRLGRTEEDLLLRTTEDPDTSLAGCALLALLRADRSSGLTMVERIAGEPEHRLHREASALLGFHLDPSGSRPTEAADRLLRLRWEAAKRFGTVDGQSWSVTLLSELARDEAFVEEVVLLSAAELDHAGVEDHLLELLLADPTPSRLRAAVRRMPSKLDAMIGSKLWAPATREGWRIVIDEAVEARTASLMPQTFQLALVDSEIAATAASELVAIDAQYQNPILASLRSEDPNVRIRACIAAARAEVEIASIPLTALESDPDIRVRVAALVARVSLDDERATYFILKILEDPTHELRPLVFDRLVRCYQLPKVIGLLDELRLRATGSERAVLVACLFLRGRSSGLSELRAAFPLLDLDSFGGQLVLRALGHYSTGEDLEFLARQFPLEGRHAANVEIAVALARGGHYAVRSLFQDALWREPWNRSVLAAGVVHARAGVRILGLWIERPPSYATSEDIRRVGFAVGQWGGFRGMKDLIQILGNRSDHPALQGALLGSLAAATY